MQVLSRDSVTVSVDAVVYYRVKNPIMATNNVEDYRLDKNLNKNNNNKKLYSTTPTTTKATDILNQIKKKYL